MNNTELNCLPTIIGTMPHTDAKAACALIARYLKDIPAWPQLPQRSFRENMYIQYSEGIPGRVLEEDRLYINTSGDLAGALAEFYGDYLENNPKPYAMSSEAAAGFHEFLSLTTLSPQAVKGHIAGPVTWGMTVTDENRRAIAYNETFADVVPKFLRLKAAWQERELEKISGNTIIFVDEPYMSAFGSVGFMLSAEQVVAMLNETFSGIRGLKGLHCCGNTDWSLMLKTKLDILSFDAYNFAGSLALYPAEVKRFFDRGGAIAWGIVPVEEELIARESVPGLKDRLEEAIAPFTRNGLRFKDLLAHSLLTPGCGLPTVSEAAAERALELLTELSGKMRQRYV